MASVLKLGIASRRSGGEKRQLIGDLLQRLPQAAQGLQGDSQRGELT